VHKLAIDASTAAQWQLSEEPEAERARYMLRDYAAAQVAFVAPIIWHYEVAMEVHFTPDVEAKLHALATETGRGADEFVQDALVGYFEELAQVRGMLDGRYDDIKSGRVTPLDGEAFFESLRQREEALLKKHAPQ
jgi:hypothetical protein